MPTPEARRARLGRLYQTLAGVEPIEELSRQLAVLATDEMDRPLWCGLTVRAEGEPVTLASSGEQAADLDRAQFALEQGPCLDALGSGVTVEVDCPDAFARWPRWRQVAEKYGVETCLAIPLITTGGPQGALNLYSTSMVTFSDHDRNAAADFARHAAGAILVAGRLAELEELTTNLEAALTSRAVIDQAKGILMGQEHCDADRAFELLRAASQHRNVKIRDLAAEIVARAGKARDPDHVSAPTA